MSSEEEKIYTVCEWSHQYLFLVLTTIYSVGKILYLHHKSTGQCSHVRGDKMNIIQSRQTVH
jgi:hypothetical protein